MLLVTRVFFSTVTSQNVCCEKGLLSLNSLSEAQKQNKKKILLEMFFISLSRFQNSLLCTISVLSITAALLHSVLLFSVPFPQSTGQPGAH